MPCRAMTSERVANGLPVMRSICAKSEAVANDESNARRASRFITQIICHPERSRGTRRASLDFPRAPSTPLRFAQDDEGLLVAQRLHGIEPRGEVGRNQSS